MASARKTTAQEALQGAISVHPYPVAPPLPEFSHCSHFTWGVIGKFIASREMAQSTKPSRWPLERDAYILNWWYTSCSR